MLTFNMHLQLNRIADQFANLIFFPAVCIKNEPCSIRLNDSNPA